MRAVGDVLIYVVIALLPVATGCAIGYLIALETLFRRLRAWHPEYYEAIGRPSLFENNTISRGHKYGRYVFNRDFIEVPDDRIVRLGDRARILGKTGISCCLAVPVLMFVSLLFE